MRDESRSVAGIHLQWFADNPGGDKGGGGEGTPLPEPLKKSNSLSKFTTVEALGASYEALEGKLGKSVEVPSESDPPEVWDKFYSRLGRPKTSEEYKVQGDGIPEPLLKELRSKLHGVGVNQRQMEQLAGVISAYYKVSKENSDAEAQKAKLERDAARARAVEALKKDFGTEYTARMEQADNAFRVLLPESAAKKIRDAGLADDPDMVRFFYGLAKEMGPERIVRGGAVTGAEGKTKEERYAYMNKYKS